MIKNDKIILLGLLIVLLLGVLAPLNGFYGPEVPFDEGIGGEAVSFILPE